MTRILGSKLDAASGLFYCDPMEVKDQPLLDFKVLDVCHMDDQKLMIYRQGVVTKLAGVPWRRDRLDLELDLLKVAAEKLGYKVVKK